MHELFGYRLQTSRTRLLARMEFEASFPARRTSSGDGELPLNLRERIGYDTLPVHRLKQRNLLKLARIRDKYCIPPTIGRNSVSLPLLRDYPRGNGTSMGGQYGL